MLEKIKRILLETPNLKARDLAKKLDLPKGDINSFLYRNKDTFICDEEYKWNVISSKFTVQFNSGWVDCNSFENSLSGAGSPLDMEITSASFIFPEGCKILLDASARLLALCNQLAGKGIKVTIDFQDSMPSLHYFNRIGFLDHLQEDIIITPKKPKQSTAQTYKGNNESVVEFGTVNPNQTNKDLINQLSDSFVKLSSDKYDTAASTVLSELIGNVKEHSQSRINGFAALQKYAGKRHHIQTIISDSGLGIAATLRPSLKQHHPNLYKAFGTANLDSDIGLVKAALSKGEVSRFGEGRGLGFKSSREQAVKFNANFSVRQKNFSLNFIFVNGKLKEINESLDLSSIYGTHLCFDFYID